MNREEMIECTSEWTNERFEDWCPRGPDAVLERTEKVSISQAWHVLLNQRYACQYEDGWDCIQPDTILVGRAMTAKYMPLHSRLRKVMLAKGKESGCVGERISWPMDMLPQGDVYVADACGKFV